MKLFVCIKQVPDTETKIKINAPKNGIDPTGIKWVMNPYDEFAVEEALKFKQANPSANVTVVSVGPKQRVVDVLRTALAMGADDAIAIDAPENIDCNSTAKALAAAITQEGGPHLIFTGKLAIDDNAASVSQMLAEYLKIPHATVVTKFEHQGDKAIVEREIEGGSRELIQMYLPAVIGANKGLNMPRYASLPGIMKAKKKTIKELDSKALGISADSSKVQHINFELPTDKPACKLIPGDPQQQAASLVSLLRNEAKIV